MATDTLTHLIAEAVRNIEPQARVILYGSRARGSASLDSDWDILVLLPRSALVREKLIRRAVYEVEWATGEVISVMVRDLETWTDPAGPKTPFRVAVTKEGIAL